MEDVALVVEKLELNFSLLIIFMGMGINIALKWAAVEGFIAG